MHFVVSNGKTKHTSSRDLLDLFQVDLLNWRVERALFGREAADRERRSRERSSRAI